MAQVMKAKVNAVLLDTGGATIVTAIYRKVYYSGTTTDWRLVGDGAADDPGGGEVHITLAQGAVSGLDANYYNYSGDIIESYTYSLYIDVGAGEVLQANQVGVMLTGMDSIQYVTTNRAHAIGDGSDHANVALNDAHRALIAGNPHSVVKNDVGLGDVENKSAEDILDEMTTLQVLATGIDTDDFTDSAGLFITTADLVTELASGSADASKVITSLYSLMVGNSRFAAQIAANREIVIGTAAANTITPDFIGQVYIKSATNVYIAKGLTTADWLTLL